MKTTSFEMAFIIRDCFEAENGRYFCCADVYFDYPGIRDAGEISGCDAKPFL